MLQRQSPVGSDYNGINLLPLYANATSQASEEEEEEGLVRVQNASDSLYQSLNFDDGFSYVLKRLDNEDYQTSANLVAQYEVISKGTPPIGLHLRKSPSLLELLENKLDPPKTRPDKAEKFKAMHFPISVIQIGNFTKVARHETDLVAKCYYAKRKLVWEILEHGLKNKIEIQWQDILSMRAVIERNKPGILLIELKQPPTFCHETDPKPRKHTIWKPSHDFTGNQASIYRRHLLEFAPGVLDRHYEKLIQCDSRLLELSKGHCPRLLNPYFSSIVYDECTDFSNGYDVSGSNSNSKPNRTSTCILAPAHQFGKTIQSLTSELVIHTLTPRQDVINNQRLKDSELAGINEFETWSGIDSMLSANDVELQRAGFENLSNMANMILTDSDSETVCEERHMASHIQLLQCIPPHQVSVAYSDASVPDISSPLIYPKWPAQQDYHD